MQNYISECKADQFEHLKKSWSSKSNELKDQIIDHRFRDLLERINQHPDLTTMYHCSGHVLSDGSDADYRLNDSIMSYMVVCTKGDMVQKMNELIKNFIITPLGISAIHEWKFTATHTPILPPHHNIGDEVRKWDKEHPENNFAEGCALYLSIAESSINDKDGMLTVKMWNEVFDKFIFNEVE